MFSDFTKKYSGLSQKDAEDNLDLYGYNTDTKLEEDGKGFRPMRVFTRPAFVLYLICFGLMVMNFQFLSAFILLFLTGAYVFVELYKGMKCDDAVHRLRLSSASKFRVIRDGKVVFVYKQDIVPDDVLILQEGEVVPADAHLLEIENVYVDESLFTQSAEPIKKIIGTDTKNELKRSCIYKGTIILSGRLVARVTATGVDTKRFKTFGADPETNIYYTGFETTVMKFMPMLYSASILCLAVGIVLSIRNHVGVSDSLFQTGMQLLLPAISFSLCFLPTAITSVVRLYYTVGSLKLLQGGAVIKNLRVMERFNSLTAVLIDKDGIITKSRMEIADKYSRNDSVLNTISVLACGHTPTGPAEQAMILSAAFEGTDIKDLRQNELVRTYPSSETCPISGNLWTFKEKRILCIKGPPQAVFPLCDLNPQQLYAAQTKQETYASLGYQVVAVACATLEDEEPQTLADTQYIFTGLIALTNFTRDAIPVAIRNCYKAGIRVIMTTTDSEETAKAIAQKIGIRPGKVLTGEMLTELQRNGETPDLSDVSLLARITPKQKLEMVKLLQQNGEVVGISGEALTDYAVLKQADVGVSMSESLSGAAHEACDVLVHDDNFNTVIETIKSSRQVHMNIKSSISTIVSSYVCLALYGMLSLLFGDVFLGSPLFIALLSVVVVQVAAMMYISNTGDMKGNLPPSAFIRKGKIAKSFILKAIIQGVSLFVAAGILFFGVGQGESKVSFFITFISGLVTMGWVNLAGSKSLLKTFSKKQKAALFVTGILLCLMVLLIYVPYLNTAFTLYALNIRVFFISLIGGVLSQLWIEFVKNKIFYKENKQKQ